MSPDFAFKVFLKCIPPFRPPVSLFQDTLIPTLDDDLLADLSAIAAPVSNASIILSIPSAAMIYSRVSTVLDSTIKGPPITWPCPFPALVPAATVSFLPFRQCPLPWLRPPPAPPTASRLGCFYDNPSTHALLSLCNWPGSPTSLRVP